MNKTKNLPEELIHRSFVYHKLITLNPNWSEKNGYAIASSFKEPEVEISAAQQLALCDLNHLQRVGIKGLGTCKWLESRNIIVPTKLNYAENNSDNCVIARLGNDEILFIDSLHYNTNLTNTIEQLWLNDATQGKKFCGYITPRQNSHACFGITGKDAYKMFSKLCSIDLREKSFTNHNIAQTLLAHISVIIIRHDLKNVNHYFLLCESASAEYCWDCLLDAMHEFNGEVIGTDTLKTLSM